MSQPSPRRRRRHLNVRAAIILVALVLVGGPSLWALQVYQSQRRQSALRAEARNHLARGDFAKALSFLNKYLEQNPGDIDALDQKGQILADTAQNGDDAVGALAVIDQVVRIDPNRREARRRQVRLDLMAGKYRTAETNAGYLIDPKQGGDPRDAGAYRLLGEAKLLEGMAGDQGAWPGAIARYEDAQRLDPGNLDGAKALAYLYTGRSKPPEPAKALRVMDDLLRLNPKSAPVRLARYGHFLLAGDPGRAQAELSEAIRLDPRNGDARLMAAEDALRRGDLDEAKRHMEAAPEGPMKRLEESNIALSMHNPDSAIIALRKVLEFTAGTNDDAAWRLAYIQLRLGRTEAARPLVVQYHRLTDSPDPTPKGIFLDALLALTAGRPAEAIKRLEPIRLRAGAPAESGGVQSLDVEVSMVLGQAYEALRDRPKALIAYRRAAEAVGSVRGLRRTDPWGRPADLLQRAGDLKGAADELEAGLAAMPNDADLLVRLAKLRLVEQARLPKGSRKMDDLAMAIDRAAKAAPTDPELVKVQVDFLTMAGRLDEAVAKLAAATEHHPHDPTLWTIRAEVLRRLGRIDQALAILDQASAPTAAGDRATLRIAKATILTLQGRERDALDALSGGLKSVPEEQRPLLLRALGDLHRGQGDPAAARRDYARWAELAPDDLQPRLLLLDMALVAGDEAAIAAAVADLEKLGGTAGLRAKALVLLRERPDDAKEPGAVGRRLDEAASLIDEVAAKDPESPAVDLLRGRLAERRGRVDEAAASYRKAREHGGGEEGLRALVDLLAKQKRVDDLKRLRADLRPDELSAEMERRLASAAFLAGDKDEADLLVRRLVEGHPEDLDARTWAARLFSTLGKPKAAEATLRELVDRQPDALGPRQALFVLQVGQKQMGPAADTLRQIRDRPIRDERTDLVLADGYRMLGDREKADEAYRKALEARPDDPDTARRAVANYVETGRPAEAEAMLREALKRDPQLGWARRELALMLSVPTRDRAAKDEAMKLVAGAPADTPEDRLIRATVLIRDGGPAQIDEASRALEELARDGRGSIGAAAHDLLAQLDLAHGRPKEACAHAERAVALVGAPNMVAKYADALIRDHRPKEALEQVDRLAQLEPAGTRSLLLRAWALKESGRPDDAQAQCRAAIDAGAAREAALLGVQLFAADKDGPDRIDALLVAALARQPADIDLLMVRAQMLRQRGQPAEAARMYDSVLALHPPDAAAALAFNNVAWTLSEDLDKPAEGLKRIDEAIRRFGRAADQPGRTADQLDTRGVILTRLKRPDEAIADLEESASLQPSPVTDYHLARAYHRAGRMAEFRKALDRALKAGLAPEKVQPGEREEMRRLIGP